MMMMMMMETVHTSETSVDNNFTWQYISEDNSELHTRRRENFKSHSKGVPYDTVINNTAKIANEYKIAAFNEWLKNMNNLPLEKQNQEITHYHKHTNMSFIQ
jgi:hypothetical protein